MACFIDKGDLSGIYFTVIIDALDLYETNARFLEFMAICSGCRAFCYPFAFLAYRICQMLK